MKFLLRLLSFLPLLLFLRYGVKPLWNHGSSTALEMIVGTIVLCICCILFTFQATRKS